MQAPPSPSVHPSPKYLFGFTSNTLGNFLQIAFFVLIVVVYPATIFFAPPAEAPPPSEDMVFKLNDIFTLIGNRVDLPTNETPSYIQLVDLTPFQNQTFFRRALVDDILIIYEKNELGILYDPIGDKIINMSYGFHLPQ